MGVQGPIKIEIQCILFLAVRCCKHRGTQSWCIRPRVLLFFTSCLMGGESAFTWNPSCYYFLYRQAERKQAWLSVNMLFMMSNNGESSKKYRFLWSTKSHMSGPNWILCTKYLLYLLFTIIFITFVTLYKMAHPVAFVIHHNCFCFLLFTAELCVLMDISHSRYFNLSKQERHWCS